MSRLVLSVCLALNAMLLLTACERAMARDLIEMNVCELLSGPEVIELLGGEIKTPALRSDYGTSQGCDYGIGTVGTGSYEYISIWVSDPGLFQRVLTS